jgi:hypothetical protein
MVPTVRHSVLMKKMPIQLTKPIPKPVWQYTKKLNKDFSLDAFIGGNISTILNEQNDQIAPKLAVAGLYT